ncbi:MAG: response regulator, partial [Mariprofundaceae bacterium]
DLMAEHRLQYQASEFAKHLDEHDAKSIQEEGDALIEQPLISAILLIDASGQLLHASITKDEKATLQLTHPLTMDNLDMLVRSLGHLHIYTRKIPGHNSSIALIMDDRPVTIAIIATTAWTGLLMIALVALSIIGLHRVLERRLIRPVSRVRESLHQNAMSQQSLDELEAELPEEASEILDVYQHLRHSHDDLKEHIMDMMQVLPACFWWSNDGVHYSGISGKSTQVLNIPPEALQNQRLWSWGPADGQSIANMTQLSDAIKQQKEHLDFAYQTHSEGDERWFGETITVCYDRKGKLDCVYGIINDISTRKQQQQLMTNQLQMAERMDTTATLVGGIAHEFNNALAGMLGNLYLLRQQARDDKSLERLGRIETLIQRSADMIEQMLVFARKSQLRPKRTDMGRFVRDFETIIRPSLKHGVQFELSLDHHVKDLAIYADQAKLQEAMTHLLHNARQAVAHVDNPLIRLHLESFNADDDFIKSCPNLSSRKLIHLCMSDNGEGIPEEIQKHIFEPFFTTREVGQGTGLGLPMVYGYVRQLGGCIHVNSEVGRGTRIDIYIPRKEDDINANEHSGEIIRGHGETILVVDDESAFREAACEVLEGLGYQYIAATSGQQGVEKFKQQQAEIRLVIMDVVMPGLNGTQAAERIRAINPDIPILFATAFDLTDTIASHAATPHTGTLHKPFRVSLLSQSVQKLLKKSVSQS